VFNVVGPLCTPLDVLGHRVTLPATAAPGDLIVVFQSGAYGLTASPLNFLHHPYPGEILV
jgi:diaminopimelate decarboxylase